MNTNRITFFAIGITLCFFVTLFISLYLTNKSGNNFDAEKEAILAVIDGESAAFWNKDIDKYACL